ncbi:MAG TPA: redoxin domain-containing protein [Candidatus Poseidoniia archaeon]|nr:redoxin domain-containing protein [Candidatus Poseidoniia archaeon]
MAKQKTNWDNVVEESKEFGSWFNQLILENKVLFAVGTVVMLILTVVLYGMIGGDNNAPDFTLKDTDEMTFSLSDYEGEKIVILDFMFSTCEPCEKFVKEALGPYSEKMDKEDVVILSISVFGNDDEAKLKDYAKQHNWRHALGDKDGEIEIAYDVIGTPKIFIIDKKGEITYSHIGPISENELSSEVEKAISGQGGVVNLKESSIYLFAVGAGVMVFFSPCSFPMLPGYMSFYLANKKQRTGKFDETAARETLPDGLAAAAGLAGVLLLIGILLIPFVSIIGGFLGHLELLIGLVLTGLGIVMVMEYDSEKIVRPFRELMFRIGSSSPMMAIKGGIEKGIRMTTGKDFSFSDDSDGTRIGLFWYGVAYGSAAAGCVAPVVIGLLTASISQGIITGLLVFLIFSITAGTLMVAFTMMVAASETTIVDKMKASTRQIEMAGGVIMIIVGVYLMYYYLSTNVF